MKDALVMRHQPQMNQGGFVPNRLGMPFHFAPLSGIWKMPCTALRCSSGDHTARTVPTVVHGAFRSFATPIWMCIIAAMAKRDKKQLSNRIALFLRQYARKSYPRFDANDRRYDRKIEEMIRRMSAEELDKLMNAEDDDAADAPGKETP